ncbi:MAG: hypothetical protein MUE52_13250 [Tabrizicola sp.]|nr:hypothetical protein [Tabrizicola sp.]
MKWLFAPLVRSKTWLCRNVGGTGGRPAGQRPSIIATARLPEGADEVAREVVADKGRTQGADL